MNADLFRGRRRDFLRRGIWCMTGFGLSSVMAVEENRKPTLRVGLITDIHYGDKPHRYARYYQESLGKLGEAVDFFNAEKPGCIVELGDLIDKAPSLDQESEWLDSIEKEFARATAPRHYVLGNHCVATLTKAEFASHTGASREPHYSFDLGNFHFVVLDACYRSDGMPYQRDNFDWKDSHIPAGELEWLKADLAKTGRPAIILAHQRLDEHGPHSVKNAAAVRSVLESAGKVLSVFQGHSHANDYQRIAGIHYCTLVAMIEGSGRGNSGYAMLDVMEDGSLRLHGFRKQAGRDLLHEI